MGRVSLTLRLVSSVVARPSPGARVACGGEMDKRQHIVVVEDEAAQRQLLFDYLTKHGYRVTGFQSGVGLRPPGRTRDARAWCCSMSGCRARTALRWRAGCARRAAGVCIIMVTAAGRHDRPGGRAGDRRRRLPAKPFDPRELLARIKSVLRRASGSVVPTAWPRVRMGRRVLDPREARPGRRRRQRGGAVGERVRSFKGFRRESQSAAGARLAARDGRPSRDGGVRTGRWTLRITRIRRKVEKDPAHPEAIRTVRGVGLHVRTRPRIDLRCGHIAISFASPRHTGGGGPQGRRGKAPIEVPANFRSEIFGDRLCGLPPPPLRGTSPVRRGRYDFRVVSTP